MLFFSLYAVAVWAGAMHWRRSLLGLGWVLLGLIGLLVLGWFHIKLSEWTNHTIFLPILQAMLYPYSALVTLGGLALCAFPRRPVVDGWCPSCGYDLVGLTMARCPECGGRVTLRRSR
ncbi:MAG: hypothetical protein KDA28_00245, partial [Phycisphaerales bacterium]|nr:hypothetical protein [Phycisphaerales bacterium]